MKRPDVHLNCNPAAETNLKHTNVLFFHPFPFISKKKNIIFNSIISVMFLTVT